jgi:Ca2+-dependent lipid-binding protein
MATLTIRPLCARLTRDVDSTGTMDPYIKISIGHTMQKSKVHKDGGKFPQWDFEFTHTLGSEDLVKFEVWDRNHIASDKVIGEGVLAISTIRVRGNFDDWFDMTFKGKPSGAVRFGFRWSAMEENKQ